MAEQGEIKSVTRLLQDVKSGRQRADRNCLVSGMLIEGDTPTEQYIKKRLTEKAGKVLIKSTTTQEAVQGQFSDLTIDHVVKVKKDKQFMILDEKKLGEKNVIHMEGNGLKDSLYFIKNVPSIREILNMSTYEEVKYLALEGSTLTFMGLVNYNAATDKFQMTEVGGIIAGGLDEAKRVLDIKISFSKDLATTSFALGAICALIGGYAFYRWHAAKAKKEEVLREQTESSLRLRRFNTILHPREQGQAQCLICMENVANVVLVPCNHLCLCKACLINLRHSQVPDCPLCKLKIDYKKVFYFDLKEQQ